MQLEITCIEDAAAYLRSCDIRPPTITGAIVFRPKHMQDMSAQVAAYFREHPDHKITMSTTPFLSCSEKAIQRLNEQLPDALKIDLEKNARRE